MLKLKSKEGFFMKNFLSLFLFFLFSSTSVFCADMRFVQVDNVFFNAKDKNSVSRLENFVEDINKQKNIEFVVFSGNNIVKPDKNNLEEFIKITKKLSYPYYLTLGHKDVNKQKDFGKKEYFNYLRKKVKSHKRISSPNYVFTKKGVVFIVVDGAKEVISTTQGYYRPETLDWLEMQLNKYQDKNVILLQHFPIIPPEKKELYQTFKAEEYLEQINNHNNVKAIFSGHFNTNKEIPYENILHVSTANFPQYRIVDILDYETENPIFWSTIKR